MGHRALKVIYSGANEPILTYGAPIWEKALTKQNNLRKYHRVQRMMNIKIAKAFRTLSYEASCILAGVRSPHPACYRSKGTNLQGNS